MVTERKKLLKLYYNSFSLLFPGERSRHDCSDAQESRGIHQTKTCAQPHGVSTRRPSSSTTTETTTADVPTAATASPTTVCGHRGVQPAAVSTTSLPSQTILVPLLSLRTFESSYNKCWYDKNMKFSVSITPCNNEYFCL